MFPDGVDERDPARAGLFQPGLGKPEDVRGLGKVLAEPLRVIPPPDPHHHLPLGPGLRGGFRGERGLPQTASPAHHHHPAARPPHQSADPLQLRLASPHRRRNRRRVHRVPADGDPPERHRRPPPVRRTGGQAPLPEEQPERHHRQPCEHRPHQDGVLRPLRRLRGDVVRHDRHQERDTRRTSRDRRTHPGRTPVTRHPTPPALPGTQDHIITPAPPCVCDPSGPVPARDTTSAPHSRSGRQQEIRGTPTGYPTRAHRTGDARRRAWPLSARARYESTTPTAPRSAPCPRRPIPAPARGPGVPGCSR